MIQKFRAWSKVSEILSEVLSLDFWSEITNTEHFIERDFDDIILMQSTGLKDDFDKEIFEGDVILWTYWDEFEDSGRAKVIFDKGMFKLLDIRTEKEVWDNLFDCIENCNVYIQGNIYENKDILEEKE
nr:MAG TPA: YopX protein [Caudoviricetes sp.]